MKPWFKVISICGTNVKEAHCDDEASALKAVQTARYQKTFVFAAMYEGRPIDGAGGVRYEWMLRQRWARRLKGAPK